MLMQNLKRSLVGTVSAGAVFLGMGVGPASAITYPFQITPNAITGISGYVPQTETDFNGTSNGLVQQQGPGVQFETGWVQGQSFTNTGVPSDFTQSGLLQEGAAANTINGCVGVCPFNKVYGLYLVFGATATGITGFAPGASGTIAPGAFNYVWYADIGDDDTFSTGSTNSSGGVAPKVTDTNSNDIVLGVGTSVNGTVTINSSGGPTFSALSTFILCNGTANTGTEGSSTPVSAVVTLDPSNPGTTTIGCGTFNAASYFSGPSPFYKFDFASNTSGSSSNIDATGSGPPNALIHGVVVDVNFISVPEPTTLSLFGMGLLGMGFMFRRRNTAESKA